MSKVVIQEELLPALRQYSHNDGSGLVMGFDIEETVKAFKEADQKLAYAEILAQCVLGLPDETCLLRSGNKLEMKKLAEKVIDTTLKTN